MSTVLLKNTNPLGYIDIPEIGRVGRTDDPDVDEPGVGCLVPGEVFECPAEIAGQAQFWRPATKADAEAIARGHVATRVTDTGETEVLDLGTGLLSQLGNFELVKRPTKKATAKKTAAKKAPAPLPDTSTEAPASTENPEG